MKMTKIEEILMYVYILNLFFFFFFTSAPYCLLLCFLLFVVYLSSCTRRRHILSKALVSYCFLVFRRTGEYISLDLFYFVKLSSSCSLIPPISGLFRSSRHGCLIFLGALNPQITKGVVWILNVE